MPKLRGLVRPATEFRGVRAVAEVNTGEGFCYNVFPSGPGFPSELFASNYGEGFVMSTLPELAILLECSLRNHDWELSQNTINTFVNNWVTADTAIFHTPKGMYIIDRPKKKKGRIHVNLRDLERKLHNGKEENGVRFSQDGLVRFTRYGFKTEVQTPEELADNQGIIALVGIIGAEKLAHACAYFKLNPTFKCFNPKTLEGVQDICLGQIRIAGMYSIYVSAEGTEEHICPRYAFGTKRLSA